MSYPGATNSQPYGVPPPAQPYGAPPAQSYGAPQYYPPPQQQQQQQQTYYGGAPPVQPQPQPQVVYFQRGDPYVFWYPWTWGLCCCWIPCCWEWFFTSRACYGWSIFFVALGIVGFITSTFIVGLSLVVVGLFCALYSKEILKKRENQILMTGAPGQAIQPNAGYPAAP